MADRQQQQQQSTAGGRPSFTSFWKRGRDKLRGKDITFVGQTPGAAQGSESSPGEGSTAADKSQTAQEKTQARRAQVRKAQIQHRQRKANYVKELELDVTRFRDMISKTENETAQLRNQNESMKLRLKAAGLESPAWKKKKQQQQQTPSEDSLAGQGQGQPPEDRPDQQMTAAPAEMFGSIDIDDLTVTLSVDEKLGTPCFTISSSSSGQSVKSPASTPVSHGQPQPQPQPPLTHPQEQVVINFILSLEHTCWNHFGWGDFHQHPHAESGESHGHTLMASAYCMGSAPESVYTDRAALTQKKKRAPSSSSSAASPPSLQWQAPSMSLKSLYGLAQSLDLGDSEMTPVQAWFRMASRYPMDMLLRPTVLDSLSRELNGVVKCLAFGAVIEAQAFESVVSRVLGPPPSGTSVQSTP